MLGASTFCDIALAGSIAGRSIASIRDFADLLEDTGRNIRVLVDIDALPITDQTQFQSAQSEITAVRTLNSSPKNVFVQNEVQQERPEDPTNTLTSDVLMSSDNSILPGDPQTFFFSDGTWIGGPSDEYRPNVPATARITGLPSTELVIPLSPDVANRSAVQFGDVEFANADGALDPLVSGYSVGGRTIRIYLGPDNGEFKDFRLLGQAVTENITANEDRIRVRLGAATNVLDTQFQPSRYSGRGGATGHLGIAGLERPILIGSAFNITPVLVNPERWIYQFHHGQAEQVATIRERGLDLVFSGLDVATYDELFDVDVPGGEYVTCLSEGYVKCGFGVAGPAGIVTMDAETRPRQTTGPTTLADALLFVVSDIAGLTRTQLNVLSFRILPEFPVGWYYSGGNRSALNVFNELMQSVYGYCSANDEGQIEVNLLDIFETDDATIQFDTSDIISLDDDGETIPPRFSQSVAANVNWTPLQDSQISVAVDAGFRERLASTGDLVRRESGEINLTNLSAVRGSDILSPFLDEQGAADVGRRIMRVLSSGRKLRTLTLSRRGYRLQVGDAISVKHPRLNIDEFTTLIVVGIRYFERDGNVRATVWG